MEHVHSDSTANYYDLNLFDKYAYFVEETATVCPRNNDQFFVVTYYITWVTTSWTYITKIRFYPLMMFRVQIQIRVDPNTALS